MTIEADSCAATVLLARRKPLQREPRFFDEPLTGALRHVRDSRRRLENRAPVA